MKHQVGTIKELLRYPVKSMEGEVLEGAQIEKYGLVGDRCWAIRDETLRETSSVRKLPTLLQCKAKYEREPVADQVGDDLPNVQVTLPDGSYFASDHPDKNQKLSAYLNKKVSLQALQPRKNWKFYRLKSANGMASMKKQFNVKGEMPSMASISWPKLLELAVFATPLGRYYDVFPLHVVTTNSIAKLSSLTPESDITVKRFRPNIFIESIDSNPDFDEFHWLGGKLFIGDTIIKCVSRTVRCSMPAQPQAGLDKDVRILRAMEQNTERHLGINASVIKAGSINIGDAVYWQPEAKYSLRKIFQPASDRIKDRLIPLSLNMIDRAAKK